jgi:orotate phosphoribosyltransferase
MNTEQVIDQFRTTGALLEGHFQLSSGLHSTVYLQCALVLQFPERAESFGRAIAE